MLRVIISPAKKMLAGSESFAARDVPALSGRARVLLDALAGMDDAALQRLWHVSDRLLPSCLEALDGLRERGIPMLADDLADPAFSSRVSPAVFAYVGLQYQSMAPGVMDEAALAWLQGHLRIVSGLYGCVRPLDAVLPYRLEMGARLAADGGVRPDGARDLYAFWGSAIAREVVRGEGAGMTGGGISAGSATTPHAAAPGAAPAPDPFASQARPAHVVNLASVEYAKAVLPHLPELGAACTTCVFGEALRDGKPVQRSTASKTARGSMVRWMAEHEVDDPADLPRFDVGYRFAPELSRPGTLVFMRA